MQTCPRGATYSPRRIHYLAGLQIDVAHGLKMGFITHFCRFNPGTPRQFGKRRKVYKVKIVSAGFEVMRPQKMDEASRKAIYSAIEQAGRVCYKTEYKIGDDSAEEFIRTLVSRGHEAMLEHASLTVRFIVDRGVSHEIVRHRLASFAQESTRYCNYAKDQFGREITVIRPCFFRDGSPSYEVWKRACEACEKAYFDLLEIGDLPQMARSVLPTSTKTEANIREWRHFFKLRAIGTTGASHPQMREVALPLLRELAGYLPALFGDLLEVRRHE